MDYLALCNDVHCQRALRILRNTGDRLVDFGENEKLKTFQKNPSRGIQASGNIEMGTTAM